MFAIRPKKLPLIKKNVHFVPINLIFNQYHHEVIILTKFHDVKVKTVDFLVTAKYWLSSKFLAYPFIWN